METHGCQAEYDLFGPLLAVYQAQSQALNMNGLSKGR